MVLRAVLFDVGDTLVREKPSRFEIYAAAARARGVAIDGRAMKGLMRAAHDGLPRVLDGAYRYSDPWFRAYIRAIFGARLGLAAPVVEELTEELFERFEQPDTFEVFAGGPELLDELAERGLRLGVVSNWSSRLPRVLAALDLARRFDFVLCSALERLEKPESAIFAAALARARVAPDEALHVGDHPEKDVAGARRAGLQALQLVHGESGAPGLGDAREAAPATSFAELRSRILERL